jgi:hypothetical protein
VRKLTKMVVRTQRSSVSECGEWVLYHACIWAQYDDSEEYSVNVPLHVPHDEMEGQSSYALHDHVCQRLVHDQIFM